MADFYSDFPFGEVVLKVLDPTVFQVGDIVLGMRDGARGRVERFMGDGMLVHRMKELDFAAGDTLVSPQGHTTIDAVCVAP